MQYREGNALNACCICFNPPAGGYIDVSVMDVLCLDCAKKIVECLSQATIEKRELIKRAELRNAEAFFSHVEREFAEREKQQRKQQQQVEEQETKEEDNGVLTVGHFGKMTDNNTFICGECGREFQQFQSLIYHWRSKHGK